MKWKNTDCGSLLGRGFWYNHSFILLPSPIDGARLTNWLIPSNPMESHTILKVQMTFFLSVSSGQCTSIGMISIEFTSSDSSSTHFAPYLMPAVWFTLMYDSPSLFSVKICGQADILHVPFQCMGFEKEGWERWHEKNNSIDFQRCGTLLSKRQSSVHMSSGPAPLSWLAVPVRILFMLTSHPQATP